MNQLHEEDGNSFLDVSSFISSKGKRISSLKSKGGLQRAMTSYGGPPCGVYVLRELESRAIYCLVKK